MKKKTYLPPIIDITCFDELSVILASNGNWYGDDWGYNFDGEDDTF